MTQFKHNFVDFTKDFKYIKDQYEQNQDLMPLVSYMKKLNNFLSNCQKEDIDKDNILELNQKIKSFFTEISADVNFKKEQLKNLTDYERAMNIYVKNSM